MRLRPHQSGYFWNCTLLSTWNLWIRTPKPHIFETGLQNGFFFNPTGLVNSRGRLKPDIFLSQLHHILRSSLKWKLSRSKWRTTMFCLQLCWLSSPVLLHELKLISSKTIFGFKCMVRQRTGRSGHCARYGNNQHLKIPPNHITGSVCACLLASN